MSELRDLIIQNCIRMLKERRYTSSISRVSSEGRDILNTKDGTGVVTQICYLSPEERLSVNTVRGILKECASSKIGRIIIIYEPKQPTPSGMTMLQKIDRTGQLRVETFKTSKFTFCLVDIAPKHKKINKAALLDLKQKGIDIYELPLILPSDPFVPYMDFKIGDIIQINRTDGTIVYRMCRSINTMPKSHTSSTL